MYNVYVFTFWLIDFWFISVWIFKKLSFSAHNFFVESLLAVITFIIKNFDKNRIGKVFYENLIKLFNPNIMLKVFSKMSFLKIFTFHFKRYNHKLRSLFLKEEQNKKRNKYFCLKLLFGCNVFCCCFYFHLI